MRTLLAFLMLLLPGLLSAQIPFSFHTFGDPDTTNVDPVFDASFGGGFVLSVNKMPMFYPQILSRNYLVDAAGNETWQARPDTFYESSSRAIHTGFGEGAIYTAGYGVAGFGGLLSGFVTRADAAGNVQWMQPYEGGVPIGALTDISDFTLVAASREFARTRIYWLDKADGDTLQIKDYAFGTKFEAGALEARDDEGLALFTSSIAGPGEPQAMTAVRIDYNGDTLWTRSFSGFDLTELADGVATADGGFFLAGACVAGFTTGIHVAKTDSSGNVLYEKFHFSGSTPYVIPIAATEMPDGGIMLLIQQGNTIPNRYLLRLDVGGDTLWQQIWHDENGIPVDLMATDTGLAVIGEVNSGSVTTLGIQAFLAFTNAAGYNPNCRVDCVWPGDADADGDADIFDLLPIAYAYGETGPARPAASLLWEPQFGFNWLDTTATGVNMKHADTNGDEIINDDDTLALDLNFGLIHPLRPAGRDDGDLPLYLAFDEDSAFAGDTVMLRVFLGVDTFLALNVLGVAVEITHDPTLIDTVLGISFAGSWLSTGTSDVLNMAKRRPAGRVDIAESRTNQMAVTGFGEVMAIRYVLDDDLGGRGIDFLTTAFAITDAYVQGADGLPIAYNTAPVDLTVGFTTTGLAGPSAEGQPLALSPNPASSHVLVDMPAAGLLQVLDMQGRVRSQTQLPAGVQDLALPSIAPGLYLVLVETSDAVYQSRLVVE